jgi:protein-S-isoprenylcysteine O-methyltransferase Ste14
MSRVQAVAMVCIMLCWVVMGVPSLVRRRQPDARDTPRGGGWTWGFVLQGVSFATVWMWPRTAPGLALLVLGVGLAVFSTAVIIAAQRTLGRQFAYRPRLIEGHQLVTRGPYRWVRHPIYASLFGLGLATGLALSRWPAIPVFAILYAAGTSLRIRNEERLLREKFGAEFEEYARRVPAYLPGLRRITG